VVGTTIVLLTGHHSHNHISMISASSHYHSCLPPRLYVALPLVHFEAHLQYLPLASCALRRRRIEEVDYGMNVIHWPLYDLSRVRTRPLHNSKSLTKLLYGRMTGLPRALDTEAHGCRGRVRLEVGRCVGNNLCQPIVNRNSDASKFEVSIGR